MFALEPPIAPPIVVEVAQRPDAPSRLPVGETLTRLTPMSSREAIAAAADDPARGVNGLFALTVKAVGEQDGDVFLSSEFDYRDPRNLTIVLTRTAQDELRRRVGQSFAEGFIGRSIFVRGVARRVRIDFFDSSNRPSGKYYFQTHVRVLSAEQIRIAR